MSYISTATILASMPRDVFGDLLETINRARQTFRQDADGGNGLKMTSLGALITTSRSDSEVSINDIKKEDLCTICLRTLLRNNADEDDTDQEDIIITSCNDDDSKPTVHHGFHKICLSTWMNSDTNNGSCPICRSKISHVSLWGDSIVIPPYKDDEYAEDDDYEDYRYGGGRWQRTETDFDTIYNREENAILRKCPFNDGIMLSDARMGFEEIQYLKRCIIFRAREAQLNTTQQYEMKDQMKQKIREIIPTDSDISMLFKDFHDDSHIHAVITNGRRRLTIIYDTSTSICHLMCFRPSNISRSYQYESEEDEDNRLDYYRYFITLTYITDNELNMCKDWVVASERTYDDNLLLQTSSYYRGNPTIDISHYSHYFDHYYKTNEFYNHNHADQAYVTRTIIKRQITDGLTSSDAKKTEERIRTIMRFITETEDGNNIRVVKTSIEDYGGVDIVRLTLGHIYTEREVQVDDRSEEHDDLSDDDQSEQRQQHDTRYDRFIKVYYDPNSKICNIVYHMTPSPDEYCRLDNTRTDNGDHGIMHIVVLENLRINDFYIMTEWLNKGDMSYIENESIYNDYVKHVIPLSDDGMYTYYEKKYTDETDIDVGVSYTKQTGIKRKTRYLTTRNVIIARSIMRFTAKNIRNHIKHKIATIFKTYSDLIETQEEDDQIRIDITHTDETNELKYTKKIIIQYNIDSSLCKIIMFAPHKERNNCTYMVTITMHMLYYNDLKMCLRWFEDTKSEMLYELMLDNRFISEHDSSVQPEEHLHLFGDIQHAEYIISERQTTQSEYGEFEKEIRFFVNTDTIQTVITTRRRQHPNLELQHNIIENAIQWNQIYIINNHSNKRVYIDYDTYTKICRISYIYTINGDTKTIYILQNGLTLPNDIDVTEETISDIDIAIQWVLNETSYDFSDIQRTYKTLNSSSRTSKQSINDKTDKITSSYSIGIPESHASYFQHRTERIMHIQRGKYGDILHDNFSRATNITGIQNMVNNTCKYYDTTPEIAKKRRIKQDNRIEGLCLFERTTNFIINLCTYTDKRTPRGDEISFIRRSVRIIYNIETKISCIIFATYGLTSDRTIENLQPYSIHDELQAIIVNRLKHSDIQHAVDWLSDPTPLRNSYGINGIHDPMIWI